MNPEENWWDRVRGPLRTPIDRGRKSDPQSTCPAAELRYPSSALEGLRTSVSFPCPQITTESPPPSQLLVLPGFWEADEILSCTLSKQTLCAKKSRWQLNKRMHSLFWLLKPCRCIPWGALRDPWGPQGGGRGPSDGKASSWIVAPKSTLVSKVYWLWLGARGWDWQTAGGGCQAAQFPGTLSSQSPHACHVSRFPPGQSSASEHVQGTGLRNTCSIFSITRLRIHFPPGTLLGEMGSSGMLVVSENSGKLWRLTVW